MKHLPIGLMFMLLLVGCFGTEKELEKEADFEGYIQYDDNKSPIFFVYVDDSLTPREKQHMYTPDYIYGYFVELKNSTKLFNEEGKEITIDEASSGNIKVWVEGNFEEKKTVVNGDREKVNEMIKEQKDFPYYKAEKVKFVTNELTKNDFIANLKAYEEGKYTVYGYFDNSETYEQHLDDVNEIMDLIDDLDKIETGGVNIGGSSLPTGAKELGIKNYPSYLILNTEGIVFETTNIREVENFFDSY